MDDLEYVQKCVKGDKLAWDEFLQKYSRLIYNYIYNVLNSKSQAYALEHTQDVFQEIFSVLIKDNFKKLKSFRGRNGCTLASWLRQVTVNFTIDYLRKQKPAVSLEEQIGEGLTLKDSLPHDSPQALDMLIDKEKLKSLKECLEKLDQHEQYFLSLHIYRGVRLEDLKEHLGISRGALDMRKTRLMERLRDCFKGKGFALDL